MKLYVDAGHGGNDPGATGNGLKEKDVVLDLAKRMERLLKDYPKAQVRMSRTTDQTKSLSARTKEANEWGADIFLSIHCNAFNGSARGYEDYIYSQLRANAAARTYQNTLHKQIAPATKMTNRGKKQANFHVLRETVMPAILTENGFIDHPEDAGLMKQDAWREQVAAAHVAGLVEIFKLKKATSTAPTPSATFRVVAGSFQKKTNAEAQIKKLAELGVEAFILKEG